MKNFFPCFLVWTRKAGEIYVAGAVLAWQTKAGGRKRSLFIYF